MNGFRCEGVWICEGGGGYGYVNGCRCERGYGYLNGCGRRCGCDRRYGYVNGCRCERG